MSNARIVLKYPMVGDSSTDMPVNSTVLHFDTQAGVPTIWVETDAYPSQRERRNFVIIGMGMVVPEGGVHRGTTLDGAFVWHLYEVLS